MSSSSLLLLLLPSDPSNSHHPDSSIVSGLTRRDREELLTALCNARDLTRSLVDVGADWGGDAGGRHRPGPAGARPHPPRGHPAAPGDPAGLRHAGRGGHTWRAEEPEPAVPQRHAVHPLLLPGPPPRPPPSLPPPASRPLPSRRPACPRGGPPSC